MGSAIDTTIGGKVLQLCCGHNQERRRRPTRSSTLLTPLANAQLHAGGGNEGASINRARGNEGASWGNEGASVNNCISDNDESLEMPTRARRPPCELDVADCTEAANSPLIDARRLEKLRDHAAFFLLMSFLGSQGVIMALSCYYWSRGN